MKHNESRNPSIWKDPRITRSKDEARSILEGYQAKIRSGEESLGSLAKREPTATALTSPTTWAASGGASCSASVRRRRLRSKSGS